MKKIKKILIFTVIVLLTNIKSFAVTGIVNTPAVRLREEPNTNSNIITNIYENEEVEILETLDEWYKVKYGSNEGYVSKNLIKTKSSTSKDTNQVTNTSNTSKLQTNTSTTNTSTSNTSNTVNNTNTGNSVSTNTGNVANNNLQTNQTNTINNDTNTANTNNQTNMQNQDNQSYVTNSDANLRIMPNIISRVITVIQNGKQVTKLNQIGNWVQVTDGTNTGWLLNTKITQGEASQDANQTSTENPVQNNQTETKNENSTADDKKDENDKTVSNINKKGKINVETANVREKPSSTATIIDCLDYDDEVVINAEEGDWYKITAENLSGYVSKRLVNIIENSQVTSRGLSDKRIQEDITTVDENTNNVLSQALNNSENKGQEVVDYAKQYLGYPYVSGGKNPNSGFDCSGFTKYIFSNFGYTLGNSASSQSSNGDEISRENLQLGDLILFYDEGKSKIGHTGIYIGNGEFIHAANPERGVVVDNLNTSTYYNERFISARRIAK